MQNPWLCVNESPQWAQIIEGFWINQPSSGSFSADLQEEGALAVAESAGSFGVHCQVAGASFQGADCSTQGWCRVDDFWDAITWLREWREDRLVSLRGRGG